MTFAKRALLPLRQEIAQQRARLLAQRNSTMLKDKQLARLYGSEGAKRG